jgi:hypothetical protein
MKHCPDPSAAQWIVESRIPFDQLILFGPPEFEAFARLRFIPDPSRPGQDEADADLPADHLPDLVQAQLALHRLADFTATADDCYFLVWDGYSDVEFPTEVAESSLVALPQRRLAHRRYALFGGPLGSIDAFAQDFGSGRNVAPPAFVWPGDHSWCFASDVDPHWAGIGAAQAAVDALVADVALDVVPARPDEPQPLYY